MVLIRTLKPSGSPRVVIADDAGLIYSDDWRQGWLRGFRGLGCEVTVVDISPLRRSMAGGPFSVRGSAMAAGLADTICASKPDLIWCHHGRAAGNEFFLSRFRRRGIPTAVYLCDEPYEVGETARYSPRFDFVFSMDFCTVETHQKARPLPHRGHVYYLPPCADAEMFARRDYSDRRIPALFLGNPMLRPREPWLRLIEKAVPGADIRFWPLPGGRPVSKGSKQWVPHSQHPELYGNAIVGLNIHRHPGITAECFRTRVQNRPRQMAIPSGMRLASAPPKEDGTGFWNDADLPASHVNPRFFEFAACATCVVSDDTRSELARMFPCAPRAATKERFLELVQHYIDCPDEAEEIGRACSYLVSKRHTYLHRAFEVLTRLGLSGHVPELQRSYLGEPEVFLTPQDFEQLKAESSSERTGVSEPWSPASGLSWTRTYGNPSILFSPGARPPVSPW